MASGGHLPRDLSELIETYLSQSAGARGIKRKTRSTVASVRITASTARNDSSPSQHKIVIRSGYALSGSTEDARGELCQVSVTEPRLRALLSSNAAALREFSKQTRALARISRRTESRQAKSPIASQGHGDLLEQQVKAVNLAFARYIKSRQELFLYIKTSFWRSKFHGESATTVRSQPLNHAAPNRVAPNMAVPSMLTTLAASAAKQLSRSVPPGENAQPEASRHASAGNAS
jgi:hypothetical protein